MEAVRAVQGQNASLTNGPQAWDTLAIEAYKLWSALAPELIQRIAFSMLGASTEDKQRAWKSLKSLRKTVRRMLRGLDIPRQYTAPTPPWVQLMISWVQMSALGAPTASVGEAAFHHLRESLFTESGFFESLD